MPGDLNKFGEKRHTLTAEDRAKGGRANRRRLSVRELTRAVLSQNCTTIKQTCTMCKNMGMDPTKTTIKYLLVIKSLVGEAARGNIDSLTKLASLLGEDAELVNIEDMSEIESKIWGDGEEPVDGEEPEDYNAED